MVRVKKLIAEAGDERGTERFEITVRMRTTGIGEKDEHERTFNRILNQMHDGLTTRFNVANIKIR